MRKKRTIKLEEFKVNKEELDKVMDNLKKMFGKANVEGVARIKLKDGASFKDVEDFIKELEEEEDEESAASTYDIDEVLDEFIEENQMLKVRLSNLEESVRKLRKAVLSMMGAAMPKECKFKKKEKNG